MNSSKPPLEPLHRYFRDVRIARASGLACRGKLREAFLLMYPNNEFPDNQEELHLLGKIAAQLKEYTVAKQCWEKALMHSPEHQDYKKCLELVDVLMHKPSSLPNLKWLAVAGLIGLLIILAITKGCSMPSEGGAPEVSSNVQD